MAREIRMNLLQVVNSSWSCFFVASIDIHSGINVLCLFMFILRFSCYHFVYFITVLNQITVILHLCVVVCPCLQLL